MLLALALAALLVASGCVSIKTVGAGSADDLALEEAYKGAYAQGSAAIEQAYALFAPSDGNPGVCNVGGTKQGCVDADHAAEAAFRGFVLDLDGVKLPPRFAEGDRLLRAGIAGMIHGLELRDKALIENDDDAFTEHKAALEQAMRDLESASKAFPTDNWPFHP